MPNTDPHILTVELLPADGPRYLAPVHIETVYCRNRDRALSAAHRRMAELAGRPNPGHSFQAGVFTVSDPAGPRWQCYRLSIAPAQLDTGRVHGPEMPTTAEVCDSLVDLLSPYVPLRVRLDVTASALLRAADHYLPADIAHAHRVAYNAAFRRAFGR